MADPIRVPVTDAEHLRAVHQWHGMLIVAEALQGQPYDKLPGFAFASTIVDLQVAETKTRAMFLNLRACAAAGVDVAATRSVSLEFEPDGTLVLLAQPLDLVDIAEQG